MMLNFKNKIKRALLFSAVFLGSLNLTGCASTSALYFGSVDPNEKTVSAPAGVKGILGPLKQSMYANGWQVDEYGLKSMRYKLVVNTVRAQLICWNEFSEISYEVFLVDTKSGREVFVISGDDCDDFKKASDAMSEALRRVTPAK